MVQSPPSFETDCRPKWPDDWKKKIRRIFQRIAQKVAKSKKGQNIYSKAQFENPKHLHRTTFKTLKYVQQTMF